MTGGERVQKDLALFAESLAELTAITLTAAEAAVVEHARRYYEDTKYYREKGDMFTAFGCITYAHGLLDAVREMRGLLSRAD